MSVQRIRSDFQFAIFILIGMLMAFAGVPLALYRFATDDWLVGTIDLGLVLTVGLCVAALWRGGDPARIGLLLMGVLTAGVLLVTVLVGTAVTPWVYPVLLAYFLMLDRRPAVALSVIAIGGVLACGVFDSASQAALFAVTALLVSLFAWVFAHRTGQQHQRLEALATLDTLTGAFNRRAMAHELQRAIDVARRSGAPVGLAVLDLDRFKRINDTHGHAAGDRVLVEFAQLVSAQVRDGDRFFRLGGEEFGLLLPGTDAAALEHRCGELRTLVAARLRVQHEPVTVSIGAALLAPGEALSTWLARADAAMYRAKRDGRDRVAIDPVPAAP